ncbi:MAG: DUF1294 domain-containing protein, partial [Lachnospiraceae bacterium]|nr:DUF1294 domain-containing protein [Lachnospiraceae bacterium]
MDFRKIIPVYLVFINILGFLLMGMDKRKAKKHLWRIPEKTLFLAAVLGGSIGSILGMYTFRHKTKKMIFVIGMPVVLVLQIIAGGVLLFASSGYAEGILQMNVV